MSQAAEFIEAPGEDFGGGEAAVEFVPALLADWLGRETEGCEGELAPVMLVERHSAQFETSCAQVEDI